jgi:hypothetical protein
VGWTGALTSLTAFTLNSHQVLSSHSNSYLLMNVGGCMALILYTFHKKAYANTLLNSIWLLVSLIALLKYQ